MIDVNTRWKYKLKLNLLADGNVFAQVIIAFQKHFVRKETKSVFLSDFIEKYFLCVY